MQSTVFGRAVQRIAIVVVALGLFLEAGSLAMAQNPASMSCSQLWYTRNAIYAGEGYCFKTARARAVFGPGCFPPFGRLSAWEQDKVNDIAYWEQRRGCR